MPDSQSGGLGAEPSRTTLLSIGATVPKEITLSQGKLAIVDDEYYDLVSLFKWSLAIRGKKLYAVRRGYKEDGKVFMQYMHRYLTTYKRCDHIDGNGLNNQMSNLREATPMQNCMNARKRPNTYSKYKGVSLSSDGKKWEAYIRVNKVRQSLGFFINEIDAALSYDNAAREYFKEFATLNFPLLTEQGAHR